MTTNGDAALGGPFDTPFEVVWNEIDGALQTMEGDLLDVTAWAESSPSAEFVLDEVQTLPDLAEQMREWQSAAGAGTLASRVAVLSLLYGLARRSGEHAAESASFLRALNALPWPAVTGLQSLRWELATASLARAWDRSQFLLLRVFEEANLDSTRRVLLEAEHELLRMMSEVDRGTDRDVPWAAWLPDIGTTTQDRVAEILRPVLIDPVVRWTTPPSLPEEARDALLRAGALLERARQRGAQLLVPHRTALALALLAADRNREAAEGFEALARDGSAYPPPLDKAARGLWLFAAQAAEDANPAQAERILIEYLRRYPESQGIRARIAALKCAQLDYAGAHQWIREEADQDREFDQDPRTSVALALGSLGVQREALTSGLRRDLATAAASKGLDRAIRAHWPGFSKLTDEEREGWLASAWVLWGTAGATSDGHLASMGVGGLARVLESVVRRCLLAPFRESLGPTPRIDSLLSGLSAKSAEAAGKLLKDPRRITLGQVAALVDEASPGGPEFLRQFSAWVRRRCDNPEKLRKCLTSATALRNDVAHEVGGLSADEAERRYRDILATIDVVLAVKRNESR